MIVSISCFTFQGGSAAFSAPGSGGGSWTQIGAIATSTDGGGGLVIYSTCWYRVATASDPNSAFSISFTGTNGTTNQYFWAACLESYTGFYTATAPIGNTAQATGTTLGVNTLTCPATTTQRASSWAVFACPSGVAGSGSISSGPAGTTQRHIYNPGNGIDNAVFDSNAPVGGVGATIGGTGVFTFSGSPNWAAVFTIELFTQPANVYTVFGQKPTGSAVSNDPTTYTLGMQFTLSQAATLTGIWFYSPPTATGLPTACAIFQETVPGSGTIVSGSQNLAPSWSGAAGSGWVKVTYGSGPVLSSGVTYKVCVLKDNTALVYSATSLYWSTGPGSGGITAGKISAPNNAGGDGGQDTFITPASVLAYPSSSFNASNYWIDAEVTVTAVSHTATASLTVVPVFSASATRGHFRVSSLTVTPVFSVVAHKPAVASISFITKAPFTRWLAGTPSARWDTGTIRVRWSGGPASIT